MPRLLADQQMGWGSIDFQFYVFSWHTEIDWNCNLLSYEFQYPCMGSPCSLSHIEPNPLILDGVILICLALCVLSEEHLYEKRYLIDWHIHIMKSSE